MEIRRLGTLWPVSALSLGGGGLGQVWGETSRGEAVATIREAVERGITLLDLAPLYGRGEAEAVAGEAFDGKWPSDLRVTTKCMIGMRHAGEVAERLEKSLLRSLAMLKRERVDLYFLHSNICPDEYEYENDPSFIETGAVRESLFFSEVVPAFERLKEKGLIGDWGITGTGLPRTIMEVLRGEPKPAVVQAVSNILDSAGGMRRYDEPPEPRNIIRTAKNNDVGVMGIRAVQAGALTAAFDRLLAADDPDHRDYTKAAPFRALCKELDEDPAVIAHLYALQMPGVDTLVLGVKNRTELRAVLDAEARGPLDEAIRKRIDALRLNFQIPRMPIDGDGII